MEKLQSARFKCGFVDDHGGGGWRWSISPSGSKMSDVSVGLEILFSHALAFPIGRRAARRSRHLLGDGGGIAIPHFANDDSARRCEGTDRSLSHRSRKAATICCRV